MPRFRTVPLAAVLVVGAMLVPASSASVAAAPSASAAGQSVSSRSLLAGLTVSAEHPAGYDRNLFPLWDDADGNGCDTRHEVLIEEATRAPTVGADCELTHGRWVSPYDGLPFTDPSGLDIDHLVPLAEAWRSGAYAWTTATRERYANDLNYPADLVAVSAHENRSKGDDEPADYLPPKTSFDCRYEAWWVAVKWRWHLSVDRAEKSWLASHLAGCDWPTVTRPGRPHVDGVAGGPAPSTHGVRISRIRFDSPGSDSGSNHSRNGEWIRLVNPGSARRYLRGWTVHDASSHVYRFGRFALPAGRTVTIHTGSGPDSDSDRYWSASDYIWNNGGDTAVLRNADGTRVDRCRYTAADDPSAAC